MKHGIVATVAGLALAITAFTAPGIAHAAVPTASSVSAASIKHTVVVAVTTTTKTEIAGTAKPATLTKGTKVVVFHKSFNGFEYTKYATATVTSHGTWKVTKTLRPGGYYAKAMSATTKSPRTTISKVASPAKVTTTTTSTTPTTTTTDDHGGASAQCNDGSLSYSAHRQGTCSWHGGVAIWF